MLANAFSVGNVYWFDPWLSQSSNAWAEIRKRLRRRSLRDQFPDVAPGYQFNVVLSEHFAKGVAGEEVEVALAPRCAPVGMVGSGASHLGIVVREMDHDLRHAAFELAQLVTVKPGPILWRDTRIDIQHAIDIDVVVC